MTSSRVTVCACLCAVAVLLISLPALPQGARGKAQLNTPKGEIVVDYGRPQLKGRDPLTWQETGSYWRMGNNTMTTLTTPVDLAFGATKLPKGSYGIWLLKVAADQYQLVFNSQNSGMGMEHEKEKDVASVPLKKIATPSPVEAFTIELKPAPKGGTFSLSWGAASLATDFQIAQ
jgi:hypothetical protein